MTTTTEPLTIEALRLVLVETPDEGDSLVSLSMRLVLATGDDLCVPPGVPTIMVGEAQEREAARLARTKYPYTREGWPGWDTIYPWLDLWFPASPDKGFYVTSFCNFAHRLKDGKPLNHECYVIPPLLLRLEMADHELQRDEWHRWSRVNGRRFHGGVKTSGDDLGLGKGGFDKDDDEE